MEDKKSPLTIVEMLYEKPYIKDFFTMNGLDITNKFCTIEDYVGGLPYRILDDMGLDKETLLRDYYVFVEKMESIRNGQSFSVDEITILGGSDKSGAPENMQLSMKKGEVICIVGPTGSGKSRLLADIEWMAQRDTPTNRMVLINGSAPPKNWRYSPSHKLVSQLSQNMNFVMDLNVSEFLTLHTQSRMIENSDQRIREILYYANKLSGEEFDENAPLTSLSGGQSRALMVADVALLSITPIVLIDEIENAGINKQEALELLVNKDKIVMIATHDPILALTAHRRVVIKNGGIKNIIETSQEEKNILAELEEIDNTLNLYREKLRNGLYITIDQT